MEGDEIDGVGDVLRSLQRISTPRGIQRECQVPLGGVPQHVSIRGSSTANPVLLFVHGGPGTPLGPTAWMWQRPVEDFFTVVHYEQRGAGRSYGLSDPDLVRDTLRPEQYVDDLLQLATWLISELGVDRVTVAGHSWGTVVATRAVLRAPELFSAYLGIGQVVDMVAAEEETYGWLLDEARRRDDQVAEAELMALSPYPGAAPLDPVKLRVHRSWVARYGGFAAGRADCDYFLAGTVHSPELTTAEATASEAGNDLTFEMLAPHLLDITFRDVRTFPVPMVQFVGRHDLMTPPGPVVAWLDALEAPSTHLEWFEDSAHMQMYEEPGHFLTALLAHVRDHSTVPRRTS